MYLPPPSLLPPSPPPPPNQSLFTTVLANAAELVPVGAMAHVLISKLLVKLFSSVSIFCQI